MTGRIVFLCRGHGYGHAARDLTIIEAIRRRSDAEVLVASSGTGLDYFRSRRVDCADLGIGDEEDQRLDAARQVLAYLGQIGRPDLMVADEVFCSPALCRGLGVPNVLLTDFFWGEVGRPQLDLTYEGADAIFLLDSAETHQVPTGITMPVHLLGPVGRPFPLTRAQARTELGLRAEGLVVTAAFGSPHPAKPAFVRTMLHAIVTAWDSFATAPDRLLILAEPPDGPKGGNSSVRWVGTSNRPELYYRAADLVIAWPGLATLTELVCNNVPTVCFAEGAETPDMRSRSLRLEAAGRIRRADLGISPDELWELGERARADLAPGAELGPPSDIAHPDVVARLILDHLPSAVRTGPAVGQ